MLPTIVGAIAAGDSIEVERAHKLTREQVMTALRYAAHVAAHLPPGTKARLVKFLLDENFPAALYPRLQSGGYDVEHIIRPGARGLPGSTIMERLAHDELVFLACDLEFASAAGQLRGTSTVPPSRFPLPSRLPLAVA